MRDYFEDQLEGFPRTMRFIYTTSLVLSTLALTPAAVAAPDGKTVYNERCAACHERGPARTPTRDHLDAMAPEMILRALETGPMRVIGTFNLSGPERVAVAEYLSGSKLGAAEVQATANWCTTVPAPASDLMAKPHWNGWGVDAVNSRHQPRAMAKLPRDRVADLKLQWVFAFPRETVVEAQPTIVDDRLYIGSRSGAVYALDAKSGCGYWIFDADAAVKGAVVIGEVGADRKRLAFFGDITGKVYAVDIDNGTLEWKIITDTHPAARIAAGFQLSNGAVFAPVSSFEEGIAADGSYPCCSFRGSLLKIDARTGTVLWKTYLIAEPAAPTGKTATGRAHMGPSGAAVWSTPTIDHKRGLVYVSTSDNYSHPESAMSDSIVALSLDDGEIQWHFKGLPGDVWNTACNLPDTTNCPDDPGPDHDMGTSSMLVTLANGHDVIVAGQKNGIAHILDPDNGGKLLWHKQIAAGGILGGIEWGMANDGKVAFISKSDINWKNEDFISAATTLDPAVGGGIVALDLSRGEFTWTAPAVSCEGRERCSPGQSAAVTAIPGVVFSGSVSGVMRAFDSNTGEVLWRFDAARDFESVNGAAARGGAIDAQGAVVVDGWVYFGAGYAKWGGLPGNVLLAFRPAN
jgi:polyvinyl alcohol dehydrogenase (cytochrome)